MKRTLKRIVSISLALLVVIMNAGAVSAAAADRNETVYVKISPDGKPLSCDVVNWIDAHGETGIQSITSLKNIKVMPDTVKYALQGDLLKLSQISSESRNVFYSGTTTQELPMQVDISYFLNGEKVDPAGLGGAKGNIEIKMHLVNRTGMNRTISFNNFRTGASESFTKEEFTPFMAQVEIDLPLDTFHDIDAPDSSKVVLGKTMKLIWLKFPYPEEDLSVKMETDCFALDPVSITLMPQMPPISSIEIEQGLKDMYGGISQIDDHLKLLEDGINEAHSGSGRLKAGTVQFAAAFGSAADGGKKLAQGLPSLSQGLKQASGAAAQLELAADAQLQMTDNIGLANAELQKSIAQLQKVPGMEKTAGQILSGLQKQQALIGLLRDGGKLPDGKDFPGLATTKNGVAQLKSGIDKCSAGADQSAAGAAALAAGLDKLGDVLPGIEKGATELEGGLAALKNGAGSLRTLGFSKLEDGVADQINTVRKGLAEKDVVEKLVDEYSSFSGEKTNGGRVEFLLQSDSIKAPASDAVKTAQPDSTETQADQGGKNIFGMIGDFFKSLFGMK